MHFPRLAQADSARFHRSEVQPCPRCSGMEFRVVSAAPVVYRCAYCSLAVLESGWKAVWPRLAH